MTTGNLPDIGRAWEPTVAAPPALPASFRPKLVAWVDRAAFTRREIVIGGDGGASEPWDVVTFEGGAIVDAVWGVLAGVDGTRTLAQLADESGHDLDEVTTLVQRLYHHGALEDTTSDELPAQAFYEHLRAVTRFSVLAWGGSPLMGRLVSGPVSRRLALGYLIETYHFAAAASSHQAAAVVAAPTLRLKTALSEHASNEYWHYAWLRRGLLAAGITRAELESAAPLPSTLAEINQLRWLALSDLLAYSACIGVTESLPGSEGLYKRFWERYASHGVVDEAVFAPFREHQLIDCAEGHEAYGVEPFAERGTLSKAERARIRQRVLAYAKMALDSHREIVDWYGPDDGPTLLTSEP